MKKRIIVFVSLALVGVLLSFLPIHIEVVHLLGDLYVSLGGRETCYDAAVEDYRVEFLEITSLLLEESKEVHSVYYVQEQEELSLCAMAENRVLSLSEKQASALHCIYKSAFDRDAGMSFIYVFSDRVVFRTDAKYALIYSPNDIPRWWISCDEEGENLILAEYAGEGFYHTILQEKTAPYQTIFLCLWGGGLLLIAVPVFLLSFRKKMEA